MELKKLVASHFDSRATLPFVSAVQDKLTGHAYDLLRSQASLSTKYTATECGEKDDDDRPIYAVTCSSSSCEQYVCQTTDAETEQGHPCKADFGLSPMGTARRVSRSGCSCRFMTCFKLPCRHWIKWATIEQDNGNSVDLMSVIGSKWLRDDGNSQHLLSQLNMTRAPRPRSEHGVHSNALSQQDRYANCIAHLTPLLERASQNDTSMSALIASLGALTTAVNHGAPILSVGC